MIFKKDCVTEKKVMQSFYFWVLLPFIPEIHLSSPLIAVALCFVVNCFCSTKLLKNMKAERV